MSCHFDIKAKCNCDFQASLWPIWMTTKTTKTREKKITNNPQAVQPITKQNSLESQTTTSLIAKPSHHTKSCYHQLKFPAQNTENNNHLKFPTPEHQRTIPHPPRLGKSQPQPKPSADPTARSCNPLNHQLPMTLVYHLNSCQHPFHKGIGWVDG